MWNVWREHLGQWGAFRKWLSTRRCWHTSSGFQDMWSTLTLADHFGANLRFSVAMLQKLESLAMGLAVEQHHLLRCFFATGSLVLNSGSHFLVICGKIHSLRWSLHLGAAPYIRFHLLWVICFTKANPQDLMKRKDFSLIQASWWDFFRWFQSSFRLCIFTSFFNWWYLYTTVW